jgi:hypothetical protein
MTHRKFTDSEYEGFLKSIDEQIKKADRELKSHAQSQIDQNIQNHAKVLRDVMQSEIVKMQAALDMRKYGQAEHHKFMVEIYKSALEAILRRD